jgi:hypothetical protein
VSRFVLDNTVTMAWCFTDEATDFTEALLNQLSDLTHSAIVARGARQGSKGNSSGRGSYIG